MSATMILAELNGDNSVPAKINKSGALVPQVVAQSWKYVLFIGIDTEIEVRVASSVTRQSHYTTRRLLSITLTSYWPR